MYRRGRELRLGSSSIVSLSVMESISSNAKAMPSLVMDYSQPQIAVHAGFLSRMQMTIAGRCRDARTVKLHSNFHGIEDPV